MNEVPFIEAQGFYLRELRDSDLDGNWYLWFNDEEVTHWQNKKIFPNTREKQLNYFTQLQTSNTDVVLAIIEKEKKLHIGNVGLHHINWIHRFAELGIVIGEKLFWGHGYGKQAWNLMTIYGFQVLNLQRIYAHVFAENHASQVCAESSGYRKEGILRSMYYKNGVYQDIFVYGILRSEFDPNILSNQKRYQVPNELSHE